MAQPKPPAPAVKLVAIFSRYPEALDWAIERCGSEWGKPVLQSSRFEHRETSYYEAEMGGGLWKQFIVIQGLYDPAQLPECKLQANQWEEELASRGDYDALRPVNIDPGYVQLHKLILASAKDRAHRIYLARGIYAEECLYYHDRRWRARPWTYPDYQRDDFQAFFSAARGYVNSLAPSS